MDFSALRNVTLIHTWFCYESALQRVVLEGFGACTAIRDDFLRGCLSVEEVRLTGFTACTEIGDWFCADCPSLSAVVMAGFPICDKVGDLLFQRCDALTEIQHLSDMSDTLCVRLGAVPIKSARCRDGCICA